MTYDELKVAMVNKLNEGNADENAISKAQVDKFIKAFTTVITDALVEDLEVRVVNLGTFKVTYRAPRVGRNPQTKEEIQIPESAGLLLKPNKDTKAKINNEVVINHLKEIKAAKENK